jgi:two-component system OmpR family response regulator
MRVLVVEDDSKIASFVVNGLRQGGFAVDHAADGEDAMAIASSTPYDAAVVDIMLPKLDGISLVSHLRAQNVSTPVLFLSAKSSVDDRVRGLQAGGDDYLVKPFAFSDLELNLINRSVHRAGKKIELQTREFQLLEYLMRNAGRAVSKTLILEHVWDYSFDPQTNVVDVVICRLRTKIDRDFDLKLIHTLRGVGYVLRA